jgi:excinuclease ABC subunit A
VIAASDWIIDLGPEGGDEGGEIVAQGTLAEVTKDKRSHTAQALRVRMLPPRSTHMRRRKM